MRLHYDPIVMARLDTRAWQLIDDRCIALAALAAGTRRTTSLGRRWFVIVGLW